MMGDIKEQIQEQLVAVEREHDCAILLAVESGSRAWGFESQDSDYDVRFIYVRRRDWYLSIDADVNRDVIELPVTDVLDVSGWDLRKALKLMRKSNPPLLEWLQSPIVYLERPELANPLRELAPAFYSPQASFHHYLHMARGNYREYLQGEVVWLKKYLYVLRPLLAMLWIEAGRGPVPIEFGRLVAATVGDEQVRRAIEDLVEAKRAGAELDRGPHIPALSEFVAVELERLEELASKQARSEPDSTLLDVFFRQTIARVWLE